MGINDVITKDYDLSHQILYLFIRKNFLMGINQVIIMMMHDDDY